MRVEYIGKDYADIKKGDVFDVLETKRLDGKYPHIRIVDRSGEDYWYGLDKFKRIA